ncbi:MAG: FKBP-type peptidyl-prolyl cis-trans isomerase [Ferruginibacter sp.]
MKKLFISAAIMISASASIAQSPKTNAQSPKGKTPATADKVLMRSLNDSFSYAAGLNIANNMKEQGIGNINGTLMAKAINDVFNNKPKALSTEQANSCLQTQMTIYNSAKSAESSKKSATEIAKGKAFLEANKSKAGVTTLPDGLQYEIIKAGDPAGTRPSAQDTVVVNYAGKLIDASEDFDSSTKNGGPVTFPVSGVIKGWTEILQLMTKGAHWKVYIPAELAYGDRGAGAAIPPGATLIFDIMLEDIKPVAVK